MTVKGGTRSGQDHFLHRLYHTMIDPRLFTDLDGRYYGGDHKAHTGDFTKRTIFSGWDVFRSQMPLQTLINPGVVDDLIASLVTLAEESGKEYLERWELLNAYSGCMLGNPAASVAADAFVKGIRGFDAEKALQYAVNTSEKFGTGTLGMDPERKLHLRDPGACLCRLVHRPAGGSHWQQGHRRSIIPGPTPERMSSTLPSAGSAPGRPTVRGAPGRRTPGRRKASAASKATLTSRAGSSPTTSPGWWRGWAAVKRSSPTLRTSSNTRPKT